MSKAVLATLIISWMALVGGLTTTFVVKENNKMVQNLAKKAIAPANTTGAQGTNTDILGDAAQSETKTENIYLDTAMLALHAAEDDCWMTINGSVYDVSMYVPLHPGGKSTITPLCGKDATTAFANKGDAAKPKDHSAFAYGLLDGMFVAKFGAVMGTREVTVGGTKTQVRASGAGDSPKTAAIQQIEQAGASKFVYGQTVRTTSAVKVRNTPSTSGALVTTLSAGITGTVTGTPAYANNYWWIPITYSNGIVGYSAQDFLTAVIVGTVLTPTPEEIVRGVDPVVTETGTQSPYTAAGVAAHNSENDCWMIVRGKVYDFTQYIPFHPGGTSQIVKYCGEDGTAPFESRGGTGVHSTFAWSQLDNYLLSSLVSEVAPSEEVPPTVTPVLPIVTITSPSNSAVLSGTESIQASASHASGIAQVVFIFGATTLKTDTSAPYTASVDTTQHVDGSHVITVKATDNDGGERSTTITISINNAPPPDTSGGLTAAAVATHSTLSDCWMIYNGNVYDITQYTPLHPPGSAKIAPYCGADGTSAFNNVGHSNNAKSLLTGYLLGPLVAGGGDTTPPPDPEPTTTTFTSIKVEIEDEDNEAKVALKIDGGGEDEFKVPSTNQQTVITYIANRYNTSETAVSSVIVFK